MSAGRPRRTGVEATLSSLPLVIPASSAPQQSFYSQSRQKRQVLASVDPAYGFSQYFKPVILQPNAGSEAALVEVLISVGVLLLVIAFIAVSVLYFLHKKGIIRAFCPMKKDHNLIRQAFHPIPVEDLPTEYIIRHKDSDFLFNAEFDALPRAKLLQHTASDKPENLRKNRYNDIKACDDTRVKLGRMGDVNGSDYVNGNFIKGYDNRKTFIATQGPLEHTVGDFWRMIYEHQCRVIIMVTNLRERGREQCAKYWPDEDESEPVLVGNMFEVHTTDSAYFADYTVREFIIRPISTGSPAASHSKSPSRETQGQPEGTTSNGTRNNNANGQGASSPLLGPSTGIPNSQSNYSYSRASVNYDSPQRAPSRANRSESMSSPSPRPESDYANLPRQPRPPSSNSHRSHGPNYYSGEPCRVVQYHFTSWNDYKAPECTIGLLRLLSKLRKLDDYNSYPVVVHCSAGVGRTGTFIAIDYVLDQCKQEGRADVFGCVSALRMQRNLMVQSLEQYVFIYKALAEFHLFGNTDLSVEEFRQHSERLRQPVRRERHQSMSATVGQVVLTNNAQNNNTQAIENGTPSSPTTVLEVKCNGNGATALKSNGNQHQNNVNTQQEQSPPPLSTHTSEKSVTSSMGALFNQKLKQFRSGSIIENTRLTLLDEEFGKLDCTLEKPRTSQWAHKEENSARNRFDDAVPYDNNRIVLAPLIDYPNTYVNASMVKGYFYPYIMAQDPLGPETAFDFWRMVNDQNAYTVVMLSNDEDFTPQEKYWPASREVSEYLGVKQELVLQLVGEERYPNFVQRRLHYCFKNERSNIGREIVQYAVRGWPTGTAVPSNASGFLDLIGRVLERQSNIPDAGPIILHCRNGSTENAIFCCVSLLLERLKAERMVDVFHTVKTLQLQRPQLITKVEQYAFFYDCVNEYMDSADM